MRGSKAILRLSFAFACAAAAACGKTNSLTDAPSTDANRTDAGNTIDADAHGPVTVIVNNTDGASGPEMGVPVVFLEPDGTLAAEMNTDASGKATADVLPGASVTAAWLLSDQQHDLETVNGVKPGDTITIGDAYDGTADGTFTVNLIDVAGTSEYDVFGPCGSASYTPVTTGSGSAPWHSDGVIAADPVTITINKGCEQATMDLVAIRFVDGDVTDYIELPGVAYTAGGSTTQTAAWTPAVNVTFNYTDVTADVTSANSEDDVPDWDGWYFDSSAPISGTTASTAMVAPLATTGLFYSWFDDSQSSEQDVLDAGAGTRTAYSLDVGATLLPWVQPPVLDPATGKITTAATGGSPGGDAFRVQVEFQRPVMSGSGSGSATAPTTYDWTVWSAAIGDVTLPTLPTDLADNDPLATDIVTTNNTEAYVFDLDLATGYDAVRAHLDSGLDDIYGDLPGTAKLRESYSLNPTSDLAPSGKRALLRTGRHQSRRVHVAHRSAAAR